MKKILLISTLFGTLSASLFSIPVPPVRTMNVPAATAIVIDGIVDDNYGDIQETNYILDSQVADWAGESDFSAEFQVCADAYFLYLFASMQDDMEHYYQWDTGDPWTFDNIEVFFQLDTNTSAATTTDSTATQLRICRGLDSVQTSGNAARSDFVYYMEAQAPGGWITEVAIPWTCTMPDSYEPEDILDYVGMPIGFDFAGADSDGSGETGDRNYQVAWDLDGQDGTEDLAWNDCSVFGYITLSSFHPFIIGKVDKYEANNLNVELYPNPTSDYLNIKHSTLVNRVEIIDASGKLLATKVINANSCELDVNNYAAGMYLLLLYTDNEVVQTRFCIE